MACPTCSAGKEQFPQENKPQDSLCWGVKTGRSEMACPEGAHARLQE